MQREGREGRAETEGGDGSTGSCLGKGAGLGTYCLKEKSTLKGSNTHSERTIGDEGRLAGYHMTTGHSTHCGPRMQKDT